MDNGGCRCCDLSSSFCRGALYLFSESVAADLERNYFRAMRDELDHSEGNHIVIKNFT